MAQPSNGLRHRVVDLLRMIDVEYDNRPERGASEKGDELRRNPLGDHNRQPSVNPHALNMGNLRKQGKPSPQLLVVY